MPSFFGTSSPKIIVAIVARTSPKVTEMLGTRTLGHSDSGQRALDQRGDRRLGKEPDDQVGQRDADLGPGELRGQGSQCSPYALGLSVALAGCLLHRSSVDGDQGELGCPEDPTCEHQAHRDPEQQPFHADHCGGSLSGDVRPATRAGGRLSVRTGTVGGSKYLGSGRGESVLRFSGVAVSHAGLVRSGNEDSGFLGPTCMLVADGVGGAAAGEVASATTAYVVSALALGDAQGDPVEMLQGGVRMAQEQIALGVRRDPARSGMATTLTALATDGERFGLAHVGDSRGYVFRDGRLSRLTQDHTYVQHLVDEGTLPAEDVAMHPWRHVVLRSVNGTVAELGDVAPVSLAVGDRVLLASDGLTDLVSEAQIESLVERHPDDAAAEALLDAALAAGGRDNVTCLLATVIDGSEGVAEGTLVGAARDPRNVVDAAAVRMPNTA